MGDFRKKHYNVIAETFADEFLETTSDQAGLDALSRMINRLANRFEDDNPRFDREKFFKIRRCETS